ncbi:MAG: phosphatase PAP2 family protein [Planctomycetes bacterium]|nr:phosphatase PAP2 family protein [Planctomycetota bacterium]
MPTLLREYPRLLGIPFLLFGVFPWYFVLNASTDSASAARLALPLDRAIVCIPAWEYVYALVYLFLVLPAFVVRDRELLARICCAYGMSMIVSFAIFYLYPVTMDRPEVPVTDFTSWLLRLQYQIDGPNNCFPSIHLSIAFSCAFGVTKADRKQGPWLIAIAAVIGISTLFVKAHYIADVIGGITVAVIAYWIWIRPYPTDGRPVDELAHPARFGLLGVSALYLASWGLIYGAYQAGWTPWRG